MFPYSFRLHVVSGSTLRFATTCFQGARTFDAEPLASNRSVKCIEKNLIKSLEHRMEILRYSQNSIKTYKNTVSTFTFLIDLYPTKAKNITKERTEKYIHYPLCIYKKVIYRVTIFLRRITQYF